MNRDLEFIVTCLELAAIHLTDRPGVVFTFEQMLTAAKQYDEGQLDPADARIVVASASFLKRVPGGMVLR